MELARQLEYHIFKGSRKSGGYACKITAKISALRKSTQNFEVSKIIEEIEGLDDGKLLEQMAEAANYKLKKVEKKTNGQTEVESKTKEGEEGEEDPVPLPP